MEVHRGGVKTIYRNTEISLFSFRIQFFISLLHSRELLCPNPKIVACRHPLPRSLCISITTTSHTLINCHQSLLSNSLSLIISPSVRLSLSLVTLISTIPSSTTANSVSISSLGSLTTLVTALSFKLLSIHRLLRHRLCLIDKTSHLIHLLSASPKPIFQFFHTRERGFGASNNSFAILCTPPHNDTFTLRSRNLACSGF